MNPAIDITSQQRQTLVDLLRQNIPDVEVWAYGSRVQWTARRNSDLDLVAFIPLSKKSRIEELREALAESDLPFLVDLHIWDEIPERFHEIIRANYVVIHEQKAEPRQLSPASDWRISTWGEEISLEYGKALRGYSSDKGKYRVYGSNGPIGWTAEPLAPGPGIILGRKGAYRGIQFCREPFYVIDTAYYVVPKTELDMRWLYYAMVYYKLGEIDDGSPIPSTTRSAVYIRELEIPAPREQRNIAGILGALDDKIELNRKMNETLEAIARAIFKSWFVDFDPVRAKAEGREPERGMGAATAALFPSDFEESELGFIPKGWQTGSVLSIASLLSGGTPKTGRADYWGGVIDWASAKDVSQCREMFLTHTERTITDKGLAESSTKVIPAFSTAIVARGATTGRLAVLGKSMAMNQTCYALATTTDTPFALFCLIQNMVSQLLQSAHGSVFETITTTTFSRSKILLPPRTVLKAYEDVVGELFRRVLANTELSYMLGGVRDLLLPRLISGKVRVPEAEKLVEAVL
jgi:type I restriction enzyme S subunit